jgi:TRAP transporter TAXI family solute receptor
MAVTRRAVCRAGIATVAAAIAGGCGTHDYRGPTRTVTIAGGQSGGLYLQIAELLAREIMAAEPGLRCETVDTDGSVSNIELLRTGGADVCVSQADTALAALEGTSPFASAVPVRGIGRMYEDYLQLVVRADSPLWSVADLEGRTVSLGAVGSGAAIFGARLFAAVGVHPIGRYESLTEAVGALEHSQVDAVLWCGGVPTPALAILHGKAPIRLLPIVEALPVLRAQFGTAYQRVNIPAGGYGRAGVPTIGVANLLLCRKELPDDVVGAITRTLVDRAEELVPRAALGTQFLDRRTLIGLFGVPMHPGAASAYRLLHG